VQGHFFDGYGSLHGGNLVNLQLWEFEVSLPVSPETQFKLQQTTPKVRKPKNSRIIFFYLWINHLTRGSL
jgi:hypothetical protein